VPDQTDDREGPLDVCECSHTREIHSEGNGPCLGRTASGKRCQCDRFKLGEGQA